MYALVTLIVPLDLTTQRKVRDCNAIILTETRLNSTVPDNAIQMDGLTTFRSHALSGNININTQVLR